MSDAPLPLSVAIAAKKREPSAFIMYPAVTPPAPVEEFFTWWMRLVTPRFKSAILFVELKDGTHVEIRIAPMPPIR